MTCSECRQSKPDVRVRVDPYEEDVNGHVIERPLCDDCDELLADEI